MDQVKKSDLLLYARNEYFATILAAKVARRLHATQPEKRPDPKAKVTSLALKLITDGSVEYAMQTEEQVAEAAAVAAAAAAEVTKAEEEAEAARATKVARAAEEARAVEEAKAAEEG